MNKRNSTLGGLVILLLLFSALAAPAQETRRILWLGSSSTFMHDMPREATRWMTQHGDAGDFEHQCIGEGGTWTYRYLEDGFRPKTGLPKEDTGILEHIRRESYDVIILQVATGRWEQWRQAIPQYAEAARDAGSRLLLYEQGWDPKPGNDVLTDSPLREIAQAASLTIVPCRTAWQHVRKERPALELHDEIERNSQARLDRVHPGLLGNYLNQCLFFVAVTGKSPIGLPNQIHHPRRAPEGSRPVTIDPETAAYLQKTAETVWHKTQTDP